MGALCLPFFLLSPVTILLRGNTTNERQRGEDIGHIVQPDEYHKLYNYNDSFIQCGCQRVAFESCYYNCTPKDGDHYYNNHLKPTTSSSFSSHVKGREA